MNRTALIKSQWLLLLWLFLAPACSPNEEKSLPEEVSLEQNLVLLTDAEGWNAQILARVKDSLREENFRVIISGYPGERTENILQRLPWLLQPGVDVLLCDPDFISASGMDSLQAFLREKQLPTEIRTLEK